jgi:hypothetical protein
MKSLRSRKTAPNSFELLHRRLDMYALAASAAGVGLVALAQPAEAKIVYTPSNIPINVNGGVVDLDLNPRRGFLSLAKSETGLSRIQVCHQGKDSLWLGTR